MTDTKSFDETVDQIADEIRDSRLDDDAVEAATARVWSKLQREFAIDEPLRSCDDVQALLPAFVAGDLGEAKALLIGDHTRECVPCRRALLELRNGGARDVSKTPTYRGARTVPAWLKRAAAMLIIVGGGFFAYTAGFDLLAERSLRAQVASIEGSLQLVSDDQVSNLAAGDSLKARQHVRTAKDAGAFLRLDDGSVIEMAPRSELSLKATRKGTTIDLGRGNIIVHAAPQGSGRLGVVTNECEVAVKGTIFAVNHGLKGSRVSVIEGEVEVRQRGSEALLHPGDQLTTDDRLHLVAIEDEIAWSANAEEHRALLSELTMLQQEVAVAVDIATPRTSTRLLDLAPSDTLFYAAMPNLTDGLGAARQVFSSRIAESEVLSDWWQREVVANNIDTQIESILDQLQFLGETVGDEIVVAMSLADMATTGAPLILAELDDPATFRAVFADHLANNPDAAAAVQFLEHPDDPADEGAEIVIWMTDDLVAAACNAAQIQALAARIDGQGSPGFSENDLHQRLSERYANGVEWLFGIDLEIAAAQALSEGGPTEQAMMERFGLLDATTFIFERRRNEIGSEIDAEMRFSRERRGVAAWLAEPAPIASLDFISADAYLVTSVAAKDGAVLFDELLGMVAEAGSDAITELEAFEDEIGIDLRNDLAAAVGGEGTFAVDGPILPVPAWKLIVEVYDPATLEHTIETVIARANDELATNGGQPISVSHEDAGGLEFTSITHPSSPVPFTYVMTEGFFIAGSNRAAIEQALGVRASGLGLARSTVFRELLPDNGFTDCSALFYRNLGPIFGSIPTSTMGGMGEYEALLQDSAAPGLFCVYGLPDRILISGSGPSLSALAPLFGAGSFMGLDSIAEAVESVDAADGVSSQS